MDRKAVVEHARPWKQIMMFIGRTQGEQDWKKPKYKFNNRQKKAWKHLWRVADTEYMRTQEVSDQAGGEESEDSAEQDKSQSNAMSQACLDFCFILLQEQYSKNEYSDVFVYGLGGLGVRAWGGWMGANHYPPILSKMIKSGNGYGRTAVELASSTS
ncbi:MAG: hypothetical protein LQ350_008734 [Teloschistes chrysophthalmus]|nr:MAG: hypothetical protein LQ350_008734 [Niorma chrysophthalma]